MSRITFKLSAKSINQAIKKVERYHKSLVEKEKKLQQVVAQRLQEEIENGFSVAIVDDLVDGNTRKANVSVEINQFGNTTVVVANGEDAVWVEFGAGIHHNAYLGKSPHPKGLELGFTIGGYGKGQGSKEMWAFKDENGERVVTYGTPAQMPMYQAVMKVLDEIRDIAREVYHD